MATTFDFIVVGGGPSGTTLASTLARAAKKPKVLLLEPGPENHDVNHRVEGKRWLGFQDEEMNRGYKTIPQEHCNNREIDYSCGRGLGGSSAVNFSAYIVGCRDDYDEWVRIVNDDAFGWERMQPRLKDLETFYNEISDGDVAKYAAPQPSDHGSKRPLHVGYAASWESDFASTLDSLHQAGLPLNPDHNSGNPLGLSIMIRSTHKGLQSTSTDLLLSSQDNLKILTLAPIQRLCFQGKRVLGVESNGKQCELCFERSHPFSRALDTPRILMHSGIGPSNELAEHYIPLVQNLPAVGKGLRDHYSVTLAYSRREGTTDRRAFYSDQMAMEAALEQWKSDRTGPWTKFACGMAVGFLKLGQIEQTDEFKDLPEREQDFLLRETVPHYEIATHFPIHWFIPQFPDEFFNYSCLTGVLFNPQARGKVTLQSSDPNVPLHFDPNILDHPFDRCIAIKILREMLEIANHPAYAKNTVATIAAPKSNSDDDLLEYWKEYLISVWHMTGAVKMGNPGDPDAAVDHEFRALGIDGLWVADMSVVPVLPYGHTQALAYVTGATCAEKLIEEHHLS